MKFKRLALSAAISTLIATAVQADELAELKAQMKAMQQQIERLEAKANANAQATQTNSTASASWTNAVQVRGVVEVEANSVSPGAAGAKDTSDIYVATAEIGVSGKVNDTVSAEMVLLYEGNGAHNSTFGMDSATITIAPHSLPVSFTLGKTATPFGTYETNLLSDPLTLSLAETKDAGAMVSFDNGLFNASAFLFNGNSDSGNDQINDYVVSAGIASEGSFSYGLQLAYMNNLGNSDGLGFATVANDVSAYAASIKLSAANLTFIGEYIAATESFNSTEMAHNGVGAEPKAWNAEIAYSFGKSSTIAFGLQGTEEASASLAEEKMLAAYSVNLYDNTTFILEYADEEDYANVSTKTVTGKLAVEF